jgi:hypothetical protein
MDNRAKAMQPSTEVVYCSSGFVLVGGIAHMPDLVFNRPAGHNGGIPTSQDRSPPFFAPTPPARGVSRLGQDPNRTGRRGHII